MQTTRVLIADDNSSFRRRVCEFLAAEPDLEVVGEAGSGQEAIQWARTLRPDVAVLDLRMAEINGLDAARQIKKMLPDVCVIILSRFDIQEYRDAALSHGASAYVVKKYLLDDLLPAIRVHGSGACPRNVTNRGATQPTKEVL